MNIQTLLDQIKKHPDYHKAGMILCHNGVVRENTREGQKVTGLEVRVNHERLEQIIQEQKKRKGIIEILISINEGNLLKIGEDVMYLLVAGDIRENVISVLSDTLNLIKTEATSKTQYFASGTK